MTFSTPAGSGRRLFAIASTSSALFGTISYEAGSGLEGRFAVSSGNFSRIRLSASALETKTYVLDARIGLELRRGSC